MNDRHIPAEFSTDSDQSLVGSERVLLELANELQRLANDLAHDISRGATLPGLSNLTAMEPVQRILTQSLSTRLFEQMDPTVDTPVPGYL